MSHDLSCERVQMGPLTWCTCGGGLFLHQAVEGRRSGLRLYLGAVLLGLLVVAGYWGWSSWTASEPVDPRAGITCMPDANGGTFCWRGEAPSRTTGVPQSVES